MQNQMERWNRGAHSVQVIYLVKLSFAEKIKSFICIRHSQRIKRAIHAGKSAPMNKCHSLRESVIHWEEKKKYEKSNSLRKKCFTIRISQLCFQRRKNYTVFFFRFHSSDSANHSHKIILAKSHKVPLFDKKEKSKKKKKSSEGAK